MPHASELCIILFCKHFSKKIRQCGLSSATVIFVQRHSATCYMVKACIFSLFNNLCQYLSSKHGDINCVFRVSVLDLWALALGSGLWSIFELEMFPLFFKEVRVLPEIDWYRYQEDCLTW